MRVPFFVLIPLLFTALHAEAQQNIYEMDLSQTPPYVNGSIAKSVAEGAGKSRNDLRKEVLNLEIAVEDECNTTKMTCGERLKDVVGRYAKCNQDAKDDLTDIHARLWALLNQIVDGIMAKKAEPDSLYSKMESDHQLTSQLKKRVGGEEGRGVSNSINTQYLSTIKSVYRDSIHVGFAAIEALMAAKSVQFDDNRGAKHELTLSFSMDDDGPQITLEMVNLRSSKKDASILPGKKDSAGYAYNSTYTYRYGLRISKGLVSQKAEGASLKEALNYGWSSPSVRYDEKYFVVSNMSACIQLEAAKQALQGKK